MGSNLRKSLSSLYQIPRAAARGFVEHFDYLRASALTFYTLLSIVPVLAALFGIAKGFSLDKTLEADLLQRFNEQRVVLSWAIKFARSMLDQASGGIIAGTGVVLLLYSVMKLLSNIEESLNIIWNAPQLRSWGRRISDYATMILVLPLFFTAASSITVAISSSQGWIEQLHLVQLLPFVLSWTLFTITYLVMPNTHVRFRYAIIGGILAGTTYQIVQLAYIKIQVLTASYGAVYGSFAVLPLFLLWLQSSWIIVLAGAEICYAVEKRNEPYISNINHYQMKLLSLILCRNLAESYQKGKPPQTADKLSNDLKLPISLTHSLIHQLIKAGLVVEVLQKEKAKAAFQPSRDLSLMKVGEIVTLLEKEGVPPHPLPISLDNLNNQVLKNPNLSLLDLKL